MHHTSSTNLDNVAAGGPLPAHEYADGEPRWIRVGRGTYPFSSFASASAAYCATIDRLGLGVSEAPVCELLDNTGNLVARVAYNGRVFAVGPDGEADCSIVLFDIGSA